MRYPHIIVERTDKDLIGILGVNESIVAHGQTIDEVYKSMMEEIGKFYTMCADKGMEVPLNLRDIGGFVIDFAEDK